MNVSIVIPTCNRPDDLSKCLAAVNSNYAAAKPAESSVEQKLSIEVIVTNDGDETEAYIELKENYPYIEWLTGPKRGPAANRNHGARAARGEWLVFLDDDCIPQPDWIAAFFEKPNPADVLEGKTIADRARKSLGEESPVNETGGYLWSCNFALKRELFLKLEGFDESFPAAAMEDVDFRERIKTTSATIDFLENAVVVHPWRPAKGWRFESRRVQSWEYLVSKHPRLNCKSPSKNYFYLGLRGLLKETVPGLLRFKGQGFFHALMINGYHLYLGMAYGLRLRKSPNFCKNSVN